MRKITFLLLLFAMTVSLVNAQGHSSHSQSGVPNTARFEIVQSHLAARFTFMLDKYTGKVYQLVKTAKGTTVWESMLIVDLPKPPLDSRVRYQLFLSGIAARFTYLLNIETGQTWVLTSVTDEKNEEYVRWEPLERK